MESSASIRDLKLMGAVDARAIVPVFFGEASLWHALRNYLTHYHGERNHQGKDNIVLFPTLATDTDTDTVNGPVACRERLDGLLKYYYQEAA